MHRVDEAILKVTPAHLKEFLKYDYESYPLRKIPDEELTLSPSLFYLLRPQINAVYEFFLIISYFPFFCYYVMLELFSFEFLKNCIMFAYDFFSNFYFYILSIDNLLIYVENSNETSYSIPTRVLFDDLFQTFLTKAGFGEFSYPDDLTLKNIPLLPLNS
jgi:hypothetical protein